MLRLRVLTALVGIPLMLAAVFYSKFLLGIIIALLAAVGLIEMYRLGKRIGPHPPLILMEAAGLSLVVLAYFNMGPLFSWAGPALVGAALIFFLPRRQGLPLRGQFRVRDEGAGIAFALAAAVYVAWTLGHSLLLANISDGSHFILLVLLVTWATDTFAYFTGKNLGRRKLAPGISPNKTVEGALGGIAGAVLVAAVTGLAGNNASFGHYLMLGFILAITGQVGDLLESALKRKAGVKDSGNIFPGHGGVLDRFDSLLVNFTVAYYYIQWLIIR